MTWIPFCMGKVLVIVYQKLLSFYPYYCHLHFHPPFRPLLTYIITILLPPSLFSLSPPIFPFPLLLLFTPHTSPTFLYLSLPIFLLPPQTPSFLWNYFPIYYSPPQLCLRTFVAPGSSSIFPLDLSNEILLNSVDIADYTQFDENYRKTTKLWS